MSETARGDGTPENAGRWPCGTPQAYRRHRRRGEEADAACKQAIADYERWRRHGRPADGPPPALTPAECAAASWAPDRRDAHAAANRAAIHQAHQARRAARTGRLEDYAWLLQTGSTREAAAARIGITAGSAWRYEAAISALAAP